MSLVPKNSGFFNDSSDTSLLTKVDCIVLVGVTFFCSAFSLICLHLFVGLMSACHNYHIHISCYFVWEISVVMYHSVITVLCAVTVLFCTVKFSYVKQLHKHADQFSCY